MRAGVLTGGHVHESPGRAVPVMTGDDRPAPSRPLSGCRLLVVEDDSIIRTALQSGLELHGAQVTAVAKGIEALAHMKTQVPDVVVLSLSMSRMSGKDFVANLRCHDLRRGLRIVVLSADRECEDKALAMGADGYLRKPLLLSTLVREVARLMRT